MLEQIAKLSAHDALIPSADKAVLIFEQLEALSQRTVCPLLKSRLAAHCVPPSSVNRAAATDIQKRLGARLALCTHTKN